MARKLRNLVISSIGSVDVPACSGAVVVLMKRSLETGEGGEKMFFIPEEVKKNLNSELLSKFAQIVGELPEETVTIWKNVLESSSATGGDPSLSTDDILKSVDGPAKKAVEELMKRLEEADKATKEAVEKANAERESRVLQEFIAKVKLYKALPVKPESFALVMKSFSDHNKEMYEQLENVLTAVDAMLEKSILFKDTGSGQTGEISAWSEIEKRAAVLVGNGLTKEQAISKVLVEDSTLYERYRKEAV